MKSELYRIKVLLKLAYNHKLTFSELWDRKVPSNRFSYHLKGLQNDGMIRKVGNAYMLASKGEKTVAYLSEEGYGIKEQPITSVIIIVQRNDKILVSFRKKEPFKGYYGIGTHGRISLGEGIEDAASRTLKDRTGLDAKHFDIKGLWIVNTIRDNDVFYTHYHFILACPDFSGALKEETKYFTNLWLTPSSLEEVSHPLLKKFKRFHDDEYIMSIAKSSWFTIMEADRFQKGDEFKGVRIRREYEFK